MADIKKIIKIIDTRTFEEINDRWVAIPGSGDERECDRCDRTHEVHAHVLLTDGTNAIVGTGCMNAASLKKTARNGAAKARTRKINEAKITKLRKSIDTIRRATESIDLEIETNGLPPVWIDREARKHPTIRMGNSYYIVLPHHRETEADTIKRLTTELERTWRWEEIKRRSGIRGCTISSLERDIAEIEKRL